MTAPSTVRSLLSVEPRRLLRHNEYVAATYGDRRRMADILAYWHAVEMFDPQDIPRPRRRETLTRKRGSRAEQAISLVKGEPLPPLPWQPGHLRYGEPPEEGWYGSSWRHTVYGGVFSLRDVRGALASVLGYTEAEDYAGNRRDADAALFAFTVDEDGILIENGTAFSSCAWATGRLHRPGPGAPGWLEGFGDVTGRCEQALYRLLSKPVGYLPSPADGAARGESKDWRATVTEVLGAAAAGAVAALISAVAPVVGGVVGAGALAGAAGSIVNRATQRGEQQEESHAGAPSIADLPSPAPAASDERGRSVQIPDIVAFAAHVADILGLPDGLANPLELRVVSIPVKRRKDGSLRDPEVFLSSPVVPDLDRIKKASGFGPALATYLGQPVAPERRIDLRNDRAAILHGVRPDAFPLARWPSELTKPLSVSQQFGVNTILAELVGGGLFSVNGPPGTGKTTLLRDLIAAIVVQRAVVLASLSSPDAAFAVVRHTWTGPDGKQHVVRELRPELAGFEIVVASSNNNAVENITKELPGMDAIAAGWHAEARYLADQATALLGEPAWGMIAAPLGNAEKRSDFCQRFWWAKDGMRPLLASRQRDPPPVTDWRAAVDRFTESFAIAARMAAERAAADTALRFPIEDSQLQAVQDDSERASRELADLEQEHQRITGKLTGLQRAGQALSGQLDQHDRARPGGLRGLLGIGTEMAAWQQRRDELAAKLAERRHQVEDVQQQADRLRSSVAAAGQRASQTAHDAEALIGRRADGEQRIRRAREAWGPAFPGNWPDLDQNEQELAAPWSDEEWTTARTQVFLAALNLHRAFVAGAAGLVLGNLGHLVDALERKPAAPPPKAEAAAWRTLFLVVPVISTTFASCGRMFGALGVGSLGWLLVDEAGQALPQHAVGALWRARRAVIVGDPLQLEPISQVPAEVQDRLRNLSGVDRRWLPAGRSAQGLADRRNRWGTAIQTEDRDGNTQEVWVGAPLRVHRRCEEPMFGISNAIAYQGLMVYGTIAQPFPGGPRPAYPGSSWIDVTGPSEGKWVPAQGEALLKILRRMHVENGVSLDRIYVLSPFRDVVTQCRRVARGELRAYKWADDQIGTVHTMQGREADAVILVLGTDPSPAKQARDWAARPANLLNVAVSRARRRLFVVGDQAEWADVPNFCVAAQMLRRHPWPATGDRPR